MFANAFQHDDNDKQVVWNETTQLIIQPPVTLSAAQRAQDQDYAATPAANNYLQGSNFVKLYNEYAGWNLPQNAHILKKMIFLAHDFVCKYMPAPMQLAIKLEQTFDSVQLACVKMYTSSWTYGTCKGDAKHIFSFINYAIFHDNEEQLRRFMPVIRMINSYLRMDVKKEYLQYAWVYRGIKLLDSVIEKYVAGEECRFATYLSTSYKASLAADFAIDAAPPKVPAINPLLTNGYKNSANQQHAYSKVIFQILIPPHAYAPHYHALKDVSMFPHEEEVLFAPYSKFYIAESAKTVQYNNTTYKVIVLQAIDNVNENNPTVQVPTPFGVQPQQIKAQAPMTLKYF